jgi:hypothetical protein
MPTSNFYIPAKPLRPDLLSKERDHTATWQPSVGRSKAETKPEERLSKICAEAASSWLSALESIAFLLLGASTFGALAYCFTELLKFAGS